MLDQQFLLEKIMGQGGSSRVYKAEHVQSQTEYAVKIIRKDKNICPKKGAKMLHEEHARMVKLQEHPNILKSFGAFENGTLSTELGPTDVQYNVLEIAENGSIASLIRKIGGLGQTLVKFPFMQICSAVQYIHSQGIAHMDLKLDNILLDQFFNCKVADLGVSLDVTNSNGYTDSKRGTVCYMAPEIHYLLPTETYDAYKADIYSLGVCLYALLFGELPIKKDDDESTIHDSDTLTTITGLKCSLDCKKKWSQLPEDLQDLLSCMLSLEPDERPELSEILEFPWLQDAYHQEMPSYFYTEVENMIQNLTEETSGLKDKEVVLEDIMTSVTF